MSCVDGKDILSHYNIALSVNIAAIFDAQPSVLCQLQLSMSHGHHLVKVALLLWGCSSRTVPVGAISVETVLVYGHFGLRPLWTRNCQNGVVFTRSNSNLCCKDYSMASSARTYLNRGWRCKGQSLYITRIWSVPPSWQMRIKRLYKTFPRRPRP